jgi:hypothetical protein
MLKGIPNQYPQEADALNDLFRRVHHALNQHPIFLTNNDRAQVNWRAFGISLTEEFLTHVQKTGSAITLLTEPPRTLSRDGNWEPKIQTAIKDVGELFVRGVCQVRNNIEHAGKFLVPEEKRSYDLASQALWVLREAIAAHPDSEKLFSNLQHKVD